MNIFKHESFSTVALIILLTAIFIFSIITFLPSQGWSDDFALYVMHARNIAEGNNYNDTGFNYNTLAFTYSPASFPPGLPILLAPVYAIFGADLLAMKFVILIFYLLFIAYTFIYLKKYTDPQKAFIIVSLFAFSTGLWVLRDSIIGDFPAAFFILFTILYLEKNPNIISWKQALFLAFLIFINYTFRPTGLILLPAWALFQIFSKTFKLKYFAIVLMFVLLLIVLQTLVIPNNSNYLTMLQHGYIEKPLTQSVREIGLRIFGNVRSLAYITNTGDDSEGWNIWVYLNLILSMVFGSLAVYGVYKKWKISVYSIFVILYFITIIIFPGFQILRYLIPLLPLYLYYITIGIVNLKNRNARYFISFGLIAGVLIIYLRFYISMIPKYENNRLSDMESQQIIQIITDSIPKNELVMCQRARAIALLADVKTTSFPDGSNSDKLEENIKDYKVKYILISELDYSLFPKEFILNNPERFQELFHNDTFQLYKLK